MAHHEQQHELFARDPAPWELDESDDSLVASIILPEGPTDEFHYVVPDSLRDQLAVGCRVRIPFGRGNRTIVGYCVAIGPRRDSPHRGRLKEVAAVVDEQSLLSPRMLELSRWLADSCLCRWSQAIEAVVPAGVRQQAGTREMEFLSVPTAVLTQLPKLKLSAKQLRALEVLAASPESLTPRELATQADCSLAPIKALRSKGLIACERRRVYTSTIARSGQPVDEPPELNSEQQQALEAILGSLAAGGGETMLLHGVTGSGKTEVYLRAIQETIQYGKQAIVLVPEISLTPQTCQRFESRLRRIAVLHSHLSAAERNWHWQQIAAGKVSVVVGARSAVFAPTPRLGLIVIDESHDHSFKQDSVPRYHARQVAQWRAKREGAVVVLGSATPTLETYAAARRGQCRLLELTQRVMNRPLPHVSAIDLRSEPPTARGVISRPLESAIKQELADQGQVILLLNRRGFSTYIQCPSCGETVTCPDCEISLTHHRQRERAVCHYCDYETLPPNICPDCGFSGIRYGGVGTEKLEQEVRGRFPEAACLRMDSDSMSQHGSHERVLEKFRNGEAQILLGTQMIAKGLDFPNVTLVGVINADTALHLPDFRASERTFQLVTQVAGRTGRGARGGRVLVQTFSPEHPAIATALHHDYHGFLKFEVPLRKAAGYPPFGFLLRIVARGSQESQVALFIRQFAERIAALQPAPKGPASDRRGHGGPTAADTTQDPAAISIQGPSPAPLTKLRGKYRFHMLLVGASRQVLRDRVGQASADLEPPGDIQWIADVDPLDML